MAQAKRVARALAQDLSRANEDPLKIVVWLAGDWNWLAPGESSVRSIATETEVLPLHDRVRRRLAAESALAPLQAQMVELWQPENTF